jgi:tRNA (cytidine56-2'-O)-methyltransferase
MHIDVVRLSHRIVRDKRTTTHCALVARALGAKSITIVGKEDPQLKETIEAVCKQWGGPFSVKFCQTLDDFLGSHKQHYIAHLTMYGIPLQETIQEICSTGKQNPIAVVIVAKKVPNRIFRLATWNLAVTNQPHSEIGALAVFLWEVARTCDSGNLGEFPDTMKRVVPQRKNKEVEDLY